MDVCGQLLGAMVWLITATSTWHPAHSTPSEQLHFESGMSSRRAAPLRYRSCHPDRPASESES